MADLVFLTQEEKFEAVLEDLRDCTQRRQPVLVGTTSIETSELLSGMLRNAEVAHEVLNAKQHAREAAIIAQAGRPGAVTIATNMAGRGTDIVLGGKPRRGAGRSVGERRRRGGDRGGAGGVARAPRGGDRRRRLHIVGTERHESRRIDNQLRGRSGRQGGSGVEPLLPLPEGRSHAAVRIGPRRHDHAEARDGARPKPSSTAG